jgi:Domain of unknown function (DUF2431)
LLLFLKKEEKHMYDENKRRSQKQETLYEARVPVLGKHMAVRWQPPKKTARVMKDMQDLTQDIIFKQDFSMTDLLESSLSQQETKAMKTRKSKVGGELKSSGSCEKLVFQKAEATRSFEVEHEGGQGDKEHLAVQRMETPRGEALIEDSSNEQVEGKKKNVILFGEATFDFAVEYAMKHKGYTIVATEYRSLEQLLKETEEAEKELIVKLNKASSKYQKMLNQYDQDVNPLIQMGIQNSQSEEAKRQNKIAGLKKNFEHYEATSGMEPKKIFNNFLSLQKERQQNGSPGCRRIMGNLEKLKTMNVNYEFGVDATSKEAWLTINKKYFNGGQIDLVQWNDPHGDKYGIDSIELEKKLMSGMFTVAEAISKKGISVGKIKVTAIGYPYLSKPHENAPPILLDEIAKENAPSLEKIETKYGKNVTGGKYKFNPQRTTGGVIDPNKSYDSLKKFVWKKK